MMCPSVIVLYMVPKLDFSLFISRLEYSSYNYRPVYGTTPPSSEPYGAC